MKNWAEDQLNGEGLGMFSMVVAFFGVVFYLFATGCFLFLNTLYWVVEGTWTGAGLGVYLRFSFVCGLAGVIGACFAVVLVILSKIIDRHNKKVEEHNSKLGKIKN